MPSNTGIKNREQYLERLFKEDAKIAKKDTLYGDYLNSLTRLLEVTNEIYEKNKGKLDKESHEKLVKQYLDVAEKAGIYMENGEDPVRANVVDYIQKVISKDLKALNSMDKEKPGTLDDAFEASRAVKIQVPKDLSHRVGGQMSDRFPIKSKDGTKKGYFTARTHTAQDDKWDKFLKSIEDLQLDKQYMDKFNELKTDHEFRMELEKCIRLKHEDTLKNLVVAMGFYPKREGVSDFLKNDKKLANAMNLLATDGKKLLLPYNMVDRLGYDPYTRNDNKNAAMYEIAKRLGCERIIAKAVPMVVVNGKQVIKGTYMENAEGNDLSNLKAGDQIWLYDQKESPYNKSLFQDLADMQILDYICGNIDRHKGNMFYKTEKINGKAKITGIVGIDNDASFPENDFKGVEFTPRSNLESARLFEPKNFRYVNQKTRDIIMNLNRADIETILRGHNISKKAINLAWKRTQKVQKVLKDLTKSKIQYVDTLSEDITRDRDNANNPFNEKNYGNKPSIFTGFDRHMAIQVQHEIVKEGYAQVERFKKAGKNAEANEILNGGKLDRKEISENLDKKEAERESKFAEYQDTTRENALLAEGLKIDGMNVLMNNINRMKSPSKEFKRMRDAMNTLYSNYQAMVEKILSNDQKVEETDYENYKKCLDEMNDATKAYIKEKGITPRTGKGRERLSAATKFENRVEELIRNFEAEKKLDPVELEEREL